MASIRLKPALSVHLPRVSLMCMLESLPCFASRAVGSLLGSIYLASPAHLFSLCLPHSLVLCPAVHSESETHLTV